MQQVAGSKIYVEPRRQAVVVEKAAKRKFEPWMIGVPAAILAGWAIVFGWIATVLFLVSGFAWLGDSWK